MQASKEIIIKSGLLPKLQLGIKTGAGVKSTGKHTVKVLEDKVVRKPPREEGDDGYYVRYTVEENGERKQYDTRMRQKGGNDPSYFVQAMAAIEPGEEITLEMKKAGVKNYVEIVRLNGGVVEHAETDEDDDEQESTGDDVIDALATIHA